MEHFPERSAQARHRCHRFDGFEQLGPLGHQRGSPSSQVGAGVEPDLVQRANVVLLLGDGGLTQVVDVVEVAEDGTLG